MYDKHVAHQSIDQQMAWAQRMIEAGRNQSLSDMLSHLERRAHQVRNAVEVFEVDKVAQAIKKGGSPEYKKAMRDLQSEPHQKPLAIVDEKVLKELLGLKARFPNFGDVVDYYRKALKLSLRGKSKKIKMSPVLLVGPPGVGKTRFLSELGVVLQTGFFSIDMSTVSAGFVLSGTSSQWGNAKSGFISTSLRESVVANPLILVDEIDKASNDDRHNPLNIFYGLLQEHSAKHFVDEFLGVAMDCSHIIWVASANYVEKIEPAILSRMRVISVDMPTPEQTGPIVKNIYEELLVNNDWQMIFESKLSDAVVDRLRSLMPRMIEQVLVQACHNAFDRSSSVGKCAITVEDIELPELKRNRQIGFVQG